MCVLAGDTIFQWEESLHNSTYFLSPPRGGTGFSNLQTGFNVFYHDNDGSPLNLAPYQLEYGAPWCWCYELELELIQTQMAQKPVLRAEVYAHAMRASQNRKKEVRGEKEVWYFQPSLKCAGATV